jgi:hypothetical protein
MTLPTETQLDIVHVQLAKLTSRQRVPRLYLQAHTTTQRCCAVNEYAAGHRGVRCTYAASHEIDGQHFCWTHAKIQLRTRGAA